MMINNKKDNEVYILGSEQTGKGVRKNRWKMVVALIFLAIATFSGAFVLLQPKEEAPEYYFEPEEQAAPEVSVAIMDLQEGITQKAFVECTDETVNDMLLRVYTPQYASMSLMVGMPDPSDPSIVFAAMAADIRKDNRQIVGDFVLSGKRLARGVAKKGFAAIEENKVTIGVGESTPLLQEMIDNNGSFFRQYPLVHQGEIAENRLKNKSIRRALAMRGEHIIMVETKNRESFHDFSKALIDIGVSEAIYLVGGDAYGWFRDKEQARWEFGKPLPEIPENISYIIWR